MTATDLNTRVSEAISRAEELELKDRHADETYRAFDALSALEEEIAQSAPTAVERSIALRGAITAALKAADRERAAALLERYKGNIELDSNSIRRLEQCIAQPDLVYEGW